LVYELSGNTLGETKEVMIKNRLEKICVENGEFESASELLEKVMSGYYRQEFINAFTTNKTEFFREVFHFEDMVERVFAEHFSVNNEIRIFSCASSSGEEIYSIAISFEHFKSLSKKLHIKSKILATDIDTNMLQKVKDGIYKHPRGGSIFPEWVSPSRYFQRRDIDGEGYFLIRAKDFLRRDIELSQLNLNAKVYPFEDGSMDVIFCRNVLIYFNIDDQNKILKKLLRALKVGGTIYLGHSESPLESAPALKRLGMNIFVKEREL